jgi:hypothetical protein
MVGAVAGHAATPEGPMGDNARCTLRQRSRLGRSRDAQEERDACGA